MQPTCNEPSQEKRHLSASAPLQLVILLPELLSLLLGSHIALGLAAELFHPLLSLLKQHADNTEMSISCRLPICRFAPVKVGSAGCRDSQLQQGIGAVHLPACFAQPGTS